jgi:H/ACA ribonucleoprotein complex subunit 4
MDIHGDFGDHCYRGFRHSLCHGWASGPTAWARRIVGAEKAGHSGTLDPNVSGVLPVGFNGATKAMGFLLKSRKEYVGIMQFHRNVKEGDVKRAFGAFTGEITQLPPVRSAVRRRERKRKVY